MRWPKRCRPNFARIHSLTQILKEHVPSQGQWWKTKKVGGGAAMMVGAGLQPQMGVTREHEIPDAQNPILVPVPADELNWLLHEVTRQWFLQGAIQQEALWRGWSPENFRELEDWLREQLELMTGGGYAL